MKVSEIFLVEVKISTPFDDAKSHDSYWAFFNKDTLNTLPHYSNSNSFFTDSRIAFNDGKELNWDDVPGETPAERKTRFDNIKIISDKVDSYFKIDHDNKSSYGYMLVDNGSKTINLDMTKLSKSNNRRPATKISNFNSNSKSAYPILQGDSGLERVIDIEKVLKALVKLDERTKDYNVIGDDRFHGMTAADVISGKSGVTKHNQLFSSSNTLIDFYHGTSMKRSKIILKEGFKTGKREESYGDMISGYSENNIYLSLNPATAANYATREAINDSSDAVILKISLKGLQLSKLVPDEDSMHWMRMSIKPEFIDRFLKENPILVELKGSKDEAVNVHIKHVNHTERRFNLMWIFSQGHPDMVQTGKEVFAKYGLSTEYKSGSHSSSPKPVDPKVIALEKKLYVDLMKAYVDGAFDSSYKKLGNVAFQGNIPASQVSVLKSWSIKSSKIPSNADAPEYDAAIDNQAATVKRPLKK
jgi:hypothetical protein